jgi:hypothetical protein
LLWEKYFCYNHSIELITSYYSPVKYTTEFSNGFKVGLSYRLYFKRGFYINPLFFYKYLTYKGADQEAADWWNSIFAGEEGAQERYDFTKQVYSLQFQMGKIFISNKHLIVDLFWGVGLRNRNINITNSYYTGSNIPSGTTPLTSYNNNVPTVQGGINIGFKK